jgi:hypothetical protein
MTVFNVVTIAIALFVGGTILWLIRRRQLRVYHTMTWGLAVFSLILFGVFPSIIDWLGFQLGIKYPPILLIIVALCIVLVKLLTMDIERTRQETRIRILIQKMGAYEAELNRLKNQQNLSG